ncbi:MAG: cysteine--tRNA ligase [Actinobacteria bacterium]|uniref:cysteine--tRNA ligase n=1 Tax=freshwater metagenome TaxID=449393 RepID=A0A6J7BZG1_9ZZZZ|nr:cysteine--tRNA ligase [Actinomycetota bacterium]MSW78908.1 cysteine--tRNA ligase [Actinomycetota bacterium]MSX55155.1 cysteine--tRNA ligase [Actinomycetota bacterium]MSX93093.1 cysteine--tRNA ligase [Actinomycetota bacterium]MSZ83793.1 cysteine--tRNA ligase [Actinomycetota bacterium]
MLHLYDTATRGVRELALREPGTVSVYLCGPTVYGPPHLGHGRATLVYDVMRRYLEWCGLHVRLVSNITDIDDKIIDRAAREGRPWEEITHKCEAVWFQAMGKLNVQRPTDVPHATDYVEQMVAMIAELIRTDRAYITVDGVYLSVDSVDDYGLLVNQHLNDLLEGGSDREVFGAEHKRHPADFALWKLSKPGEPSWSAPWGDGRPGWHSECVVMSLDILGEGFDLHCGGMDLKFPHHENERAQAVALGKRFANHWMHNGFVVDAEGEKMSKSLGNVANLLDLMEHYDPRAYRMLLLQSHYRGPVSVGQDNIDASVKSLAGLDSYAARTSGVAAAAPDADVLARFRERMDDDLDTPAATALLFDTVRRANAGLDAGSGEVPGLVAAVHEICTAFGLVLNAGGEVPADMAAKAAALDAARAAKDFAAADVLRAELQDAGWTVETSKSGTTLRR